MTSITTSSAASGQPMTVSWTVANQGLGSTPADSWSDQLVLSADNDLTTTADNTTLGTFVHTGSLAPGGHYTDSETVTLPVGISGTYHLFVTADSNNNVFEGSGETNKRPRSICRWRFRRPRIFRSPASRSPAAYGRGSRCPSSGP